MNLLLVDDEKLLVKGLSASLRKEGFGVFAAFEGKQALEILNTEKIDMILLDIMLPVMDGITLLRKIRETMIIPIIMLTAKDDYADMVLGLELGADDYVTKPFHTRVLIARIHSLARRISMLQAGTASVEQGIINTGKLKIDINRRTLHKNGQEINLTAKEFDILVTLVRNSEIVLSREKLFDLVWQELDCDTRTVDVHISKLREKIEDDTANPSYIRTKWGVGYYFKKEGVG
ncbi:MAG: response regulator transcription factor [Clostridia bacterium]|nr:response regulator transcription factor [Clostridia bacterium]